MKRSLWIIVISLTIAFITYPLQVDFSYGETECMITCISDARDDDALQKTESISINYARADKRVRIERYTRIVERAMAEKAVQFYIAVINDTGLLTETIKRDYSGDDPLHAS